MRIALVLLVACSKPNISADIPDTAPSAIPTGGDYETLWCRGGGKSSASTDVKLLTFSAKSKGTSVTTDFQFAKSSKAAGNDGMALEPGTCAYADRTFAGDPIRLTYVEESEAHIRWQTTSSGSTAPTVSVPADDVRSDKWLMKAQVTSKNYIGSYQTFTR